MPIGPVLVVGFVVVAAVGISLYLVFSDSEK